MFPIRNPLLSCLHPTIGTTAKTAAISIRRLSRPSLTGLRGPRWSVAPKLTFLGFRQLFGHCEAERAGDEAREERGRGAGGRGHARIDW